MLYMPLAILQPLTATQTEAPRYRTKKESRTITIFPSYYSHKHRLTLKGEARAKLVAGLVQLLGIERATNAKGQTAVDLGVVGEGSNAEVVDLGLSFMH
jgi:hypothetical protein